MNKGNLKVSVKTDQGMVLSQEHGFTVEEADGKVLSFDVIEHEEYGVVLLFGDQVFFLKYWEDEALDKAETNIKRAVFKERTRRHGKSRQDPV
jgi:hypothetical protein